MKSLALALLLFVGITGNAVHANVEEADCSSGLDACYRTCQGQQPSPEAGCFNRCDQVFLRCIYQNQ
jgi:hypothetical protein